jgi:hypothetical protein
MAKGEKSNLTWGMVIPRVKILLIPFLLWTGLRFVMWRRLPDNLDEVLSPYAFVPLLIQFYLVSPLLIPVAKNRWKLFLILAAIIHLGVQAVRYLNGLGVTFPGQAQILSLTPWWFILGQQPLWFPLGLVASLHLPEFKAWLDRYPRVFLIGTIVFGVMSILEFQLVEYLNGEQMLEFSFGGFTRTFFIFFFLIWFMTLDERRIPFSKTLSTIAPRSLGIYLANIPAIYVTALLMYQFTPLLLGSQFFYIGILFLVGLLIPLLVMEVTRRTPARRVYRYIFG